MKKPELNIKDLRELHRSGDLEEAKKGYLAILQEHPDCVEVLYELGILSAQQNDFSEAVEYLQTAVEFQPDNVSLQVNLGNALKALGLFNQAAQVLKQPSNSIPITAML